MKDDTIDRDIVMRFVESHAFMWFPCSLCSGSTKKVQIHCVATLADGSQIRCCETCLEAGQELNDKRIRSTIASAEAHTAFLRGLVGRVSIPSYQEWEAAEKAYEDEWVAEHVAAPVQYDDEPIEKAEQEFRRAREALRKSRRSTTGRSVWRSTHSRRETAR